MIRLSTTGIVQ